MGYTCLGCPADRHIARTRLLWTELVYPRPCTCRALYEPSDSVQWNRGPVYDYHPDIVKPDEEATEPKLGDCSICMEPISADQGDIGPERGKALQLCWKQAAKKRRIYALAPCGHNFVRSFVHNRLNVRSSFQHTDCLEQWMEIKSICPQCRGYLPQL